MNSNELENEKEYDKYLTSELDKLPKEELIKLARLAFYMPAPQKRQGFRYLHAFNKGEENDQTPRQFDLSQYKPKRYRAHF